jgi:hypothetical protein
VDFAQEVFPVLQRACFECHGHEVQKGGLRLDQRDSVLRHPGESGKPVVLAGKADASELLRRVSLKKGDADAMPKRGDLLKPADIAVLRAWITEGARWPDAMETALHWSYAPPRKASLPSVILRSWPRNAIDHHVLARLEREGLAPSPEADKAVLLRRVSLDLTGLPPSVAEVDRFLRESSSSPGQAYEQAVDRLLKSPEFGVRWARPWLDLARYADSHGFQRDDLRDIWAYRDWVVGALNADMPFDQFTIEQVAGDLLPGATPDQIVATGFHRCTPTNVEAGTDPEESRVNQVLDRVNTTGAVWLGTTLECCQCHNHKYDPFTMKDYYQIMACFNNTEKEAERTNPNAPGSIRFNGVPLALEDAAKRAEREMLAAELKKIEAQLAAMAKAGRLAASDAGEPGSAMPLTVTGFISEGGAESEVQPDKSVLVTGEVPNTDVYTVELQLAGKGITGLKLEALKHPALPGSGPGRGDPVRTNFVLHELEVFFTPKGGVEERLSFGAAQASFSQTKFDVSGAVDGRADTGWAIGPRFDQPHWAVFSLAEPLDAPEGSELRVRMVQQLRGGRSIGCFRISSITGALPSLAAAGESDEKPAAAKPRQARRGQKAAAAPAAPAVSSDPEMARLQRLKAAMEKKIAALAPPTTEVMREMPQPRMTAIFNRGVYTDPREKVTPGTPAILPKPAAPTRNRLDLARWLVSPANPLAARVQVNRVWHEIFGQGIVTTVEDFGIKGERPSHPELLDLLAVEFMEQGWSLKKLVRKIVTSATYRQGSAQSGSPLAARGLERDPANTLLWRGPRFRLDAEAIRDNALAIAGLLSTGKGGPPIRPPQPDGLWKKVGGQDYQYAVSPGEQKYRRGLYVVLKRGSPYPSFMNFDASARMACVVKRSRSNTPLQALTLLNDPVFTEAAAALAARIAREAPGPGIHERLRHGFRLVLAREPESGEMAQLLRVCEGRKDEGEALRDVAAVLLNLDETITKG